MLDVVHTGLGEQAELKDCIPLTGPGPAVKAGEAEKGKIPLILVIKDEQRQREEAEETTVALNRILNKCFQSISNCLWKRRLETREKALQGESLLIVNSEMGVLVKLGSPCCCEELQLSAKAHATHTAGCRGLQL